MCPREIAHMAPAEGSLGLTALLDDLLLEEARLERAEARAAGVVTEDDDAPCEEPQLSPEDQQQLAELHQDVDGCLASMQNWEEESRQRRAKLMKDMEAEYGFSCDLEGESGRAELQNLDNFDANLEDDMSRSEEDMSQYLGGANRRQHRHCEPKPVGPFMEAQAPVVSTSSKSIARDEKRQADSERIDKLRAEVEAMKQREVMGLGPYDSMQPDDDLDTTVGVAAGLASWCDEVDAVLEDPSLDAGSGGLTRAKEGLNQIDSGLGEAQCRLNDDILEMEKLLADCNAQIKARKAAGLDK